MNGVKTTIIYEDALYINATDKPINELLLEDVEEFKQQNPLPKGYDYPVQLVIFFSYLLPEQVI